MPRRAAAASFAAAVALGAGCGDGAPDDYDADVERQFMTTCLAEQDADLCRCLYDRIVDEIPYDRFVEIDRELADPDAVPDDVAALAVDCATEDVVGE